MVNIALNVRFYFGPKVVYFVMLMWLVFGVLSSARDRVWSNIPNRKFDYLFTFVLLQVTEVILFKL